MKRELPSLAKKLRLLRNIVARRPLWCTWQVTYRCRFRCRFCNYWSLPSSAGEETPPEVFARGAEKLSRIGSLMISLAGGEPFLRGDMEEIVRAVAPHHFPFVTTNGWGVTRERASACYRNGLWGASISIDYADPDRHDAMRGRKGAFDRAVRALRFFSEERTSAAQRVNLMCVLFDDNLEEIEPLLKLAQRYRANFMVQPYSPVKTGEKGFKAAAGVSQRLLSLQKRYRNFLSNPVFLSRFDEALNGGVPGCRAGRSTFNIDQKGEISVCVEMRRRPVANLLKHSPGEILYALREAARDISCRACWFNCRGEMEALYSFRGAIHSLVTLCTTRSSIRS